MNLCVNVKHFRPSRKAEKQNKIRCYSYFSAPTAGHTSLLDMSNRKFRMHFLSGICLFIKSLFFSFPKLDRPQQVFGLSSQQELKPTSAGEKLTAGV